jgi:hypothetical protein
MLWSLMDGVAERLAASHALCRKAEQLQRESRALITQVRHQQRRHPLRRLWCLARGASDDLLIALDPRCPRCGGAAVTPTGYILATGGAIYAREQCAACSKPFLVARRPRRPAVEPRRATAPTPPPDEDDGEIVTDTGPRL